MLNKDSEFVEINKVRNKYISYIFVLSDTENCDWASDCGSTQNEQSSIQSDDVLDHHAYLYIFVVLAQWNNSPRVNILFQSDLLSWVRPSTLTIIPQMRCLKTEIYTYDMDSRFEIHHLSNLDNIVGSKLF